MRFRLLIYLLKWYCSKEMDQWEMWKFNTKYGKVFVQISREPGCSEDIYVKL